MPAVAFAFLSIELGAKRASHHMARNKCRAGYSRQPARRGHRAVRRRLGDLRSRDIRSCCDRCQWCMDHVHGSFGKASDLPSDRPLASRRRAADHGDRRETTADSLWITWRHRSHCARSGYVGTSWRRARRWRTEYSGPRMASAWASVAGRTRAPVCRCWTCARD